MENERFERSRMLLIVDPQIDFINGTLPVPGAEKAMDDLAKYLEEHGKVYQHIFVTCDRHPIDHISFKRFGGPWPPHCVTASVGGAIWPPLMDYFLEHVPQIIILFKGENSDEDEYSIFASESGRNDIAEYFLEVGSAIEIDVCGLAGDVCVATTLEDALRLFPDHIYKVLLEYTASLDGGEKIRKLAEDMERRNARLWPGEFWGDSR